MLIEAGERPSGKVERKELATPWISEGAVMRDKAGCICLGSPSFVPMEGMRRGLLAKVQSSTRYSA